MIVQDLRQLAGRYATESAIGCQTKRGHRASRSRNAVRETFHAVNHAHIEARFAGVELFKWRVVGVISFIQNWHMDPIDGTTGRLNRCIDQCHRTAQIGRRERGPPAKGAKTEMKPKRHLGGQGGREPLDWRGMRFNSGFTFRQAASTVHCG